MPFPKTVLVLCTGNSARSILGECLINKLGAGRYIAYSAGSQPAGQVNPHAIDLLQEQGFDTSGLRSKSWDEFTGPQAPHIDYVITVCGNAANEVCPVFPGRATRTHWGIADPAAAPEAAKPAAFREAFRLMEARVAAFLELPLADMLPDAQELALNAIGRMEGAA